MDENRESLISKIKYVIDMFPSVTEAFIFGSYATGDYNDYSDIDVAIDCDIDDYLDIIDRLEDIDTIRRFDVHNIKLSNFAFDVRSIKDVIQLH